MNNHDLSCTMTDDYLRPLSWFSKIYTLKTCSKYLKTLQHLNRTLYNYVIIWFKNKKKIFCHTLLNKNSLLPLLSLIYIFTKIVSFSTFSVIETSLGARLKGKLTIGNNGECWASLIHTTPNVLWRIFLPRSWLS